VESARRATAADLPRVDELSLMARAELGAQERGGVVFVNREARAEPSAALLEDPGRIVVVGAFDDTVVGFGTGRIEPLRNGTVLGVNDDLYVEPEARGVGVGEAMMGELLAWFRARECVGVDAFALPGMRATKNFFETFGFTARLLVVHHRLDRTGDGDAPA
jgi:GNAT superfamily N-acetyltransferase